MKKTFLLISFFLSLNFSYAQNTSPWPATGDIGIGTTSPAARLHILGTGTQLRLAQGTGFTDFIQNGNITTINASSNFKLNWGNNSLAFEGDAAGKFYLNSTDGAFVNGYGGFKVALTEKFGFYTNGGAKFNAIGAVVTDANNIGLSFHTKKAGTEAEAVRIASSGNLMVGNTVDDGNRLQVYGDFTFAHPALAHIKSPRYSILLGDEGGGTYLFYGNSTGLPIHIGTANGLNWHKFYFQKAGQPNDDIANYNFIYNTNKGAGFQIYSYNEAQTKLLLSAPGNLILGGSTDNTNKLQVNGNVWATGMIIPTNAAAGKVLTSDANGNASWQTATGGSTGWSMDGNSTGGLKKLGTTDLQDLQIITGNSEQMRITKDGNIGIGTPTPQAKLAVNGDVYARKVKVTATGWPDYVFQPAYQLLPLPEVEKYILQHRHLPEMSSGTEVETNGLDLGNNQAALLKKIEELTLHAIAQHKKIETKDQELVELKSVVKDLLQRIEKLEKK